ncbi:hypothetical protein [Paracoccus beibuensis]|uniref:hypothetical protein n=1 Tax=Paracoccus beibuensis TaxID=547602 RepID=UPI00223E9DA1|nr:hypothetical protein [Paracoccus beibuensis]
MGHTLVERNWLIVWRDLTHTGGLAERKARLSRYRTRGALLVLPLPPSDWTIDADGRQCKPMAFLTCQVWA